MKLKHYPATSLAMNLMLVDHVKEANRRLKIRQAIAQINLEPVGIFDRAEEELAKLNVTDLNQLCNKSAPEEDDPEVSDEVVIVLNSLYHMISGWRPQQ